MEPRKREDKKWWKYYDHCKDEAQLCFTNFYAIEATAGSLQEAFNQGESLVFSIFPGDQQGVTIPRNYFCSWNVELDPSKQYWL